MILDIYFRYPGLGNHNFCRNPDPDSADKFPWCYNGQGTDPPFDWCDIPYCDTGNIDAFRDLRNLFMFDNLSAVSCSNVILNLICGSSSW